MNQRMNPKAEETKFLFFVLIFVVLEAILFFSGNHEFKTKFTEEEKRIKTVQNIFDSVSTEAKAVSIYNATLNVKIYGRNDDLVMPIASIAKIMSVIVALNNQKPESDVFISADSIRQDGDYGLFLNEKFKVSDLAKITLINSSNDGAHALLLNVSNALEKMNDKARKIGMKNNFFFNFTGLDIDKSRAGAYASAQDVNMMTIYAFKAYPEIFSVTVIPEITIKSESRLDHSAKNTNTILDKIPNILFSKTGLTPLAGGNLSIIFKNKNGHEIAVTVLGSTEEGRFLDMEKLVNTLHNLN